MFSRIMKAIPAFIKNPPIPRRFSGHTNSPLSVDSSGIFSKKARLLVGTLGSGMGVALSVSEEGERTNDGGNPSFRDRKILEYENRIRTFSTPDKIFRYFATVRVDDVVYMTIDDLYRAITPGEIQPKNLGLDQFRSWTHQRLEEEFERGAHGGTVLGDIFGKGLISFVDYLLLISLISIPLWHVEVCFNMMDLDGNGIITLEEFRRMKELVIARSSIGNRHRDTTHGTHSSSRRGTTCIEKYFFGDSLEGEIKLGEFVVFLRNLQKDMADHDFKRYSLERIPAVKFAEGFAHYTHMSSAKKRHVLKNLKNREEELFVSYDDYSHFMQLLTRIDDLILILDFYDLSDVTFNKESLRRLSRIVTGRELSSSMIEILFTVLDENGDGHLSNHEFLFLLKKALSRGLDKPKDTQFLRTISILFSCATKS